MPGLSIRAKTRGSRVTEVIAEGPLAPLARPTIRLMDDFIVKEKPAYIGKNYLIPGLFFPPIPSPVFTRALRNQIRIALTRRNLPEVLSISVTEACMISCFHCGHWGRRKTPELSLEEIKGLIDEAIRMGTFNVTLTGGDPVLRDDIEEIIRHVPRDQAVTTMFTPGWNLAHRARELKEAGLYSVYVILQSRESRVHDEIAERDGAHERAVEAIGACLDEGLLVGAATYMDAERLRDGTVEDLIAFSDELGCHEILLSDPIPTGRVLRREDLILNDDDRRILVGLQDEHNSRDGGVKVFTNACVKGPRGVGCVAGTRWVHVTGVGEVSPCDYTPISFGNIRDGGLMPAWERIQNHPTYREHAELCRMQEQGFRERYIHPIPDDAYLPYPILE